MDNKEQKKKKLEKILPTIIGLGVVFIFIQWDTAKSEIEHYELRQSLEINAQLRELDDLFFSMEETLNTYEFPVEDELKVYYQDAIGNDIQSLDHIAQTIEGLNQFSNFRMNNKKDLEEIERIFKGLRGFNYSEEEKEIAVEALSEVQSELYSLMYVGNFSIENKADREQVSAILDSFIEKLSVLKRY